MVTRGREERKGILGDDGGNGGNDGGEMAREGGENDGEITEGSGIGFSAMYCLMIWNF